MLERSRPEPEANENKSEKMSRRGILAILAGSALAAEGLKKLGDMASTLDKEQRQNSTREQELVHPRLSLSEAPDWLPAVTNLNQPVGYKISHPYGQSPYKVITFPGNKTPGLPVDESMADAASISQDQRDAIRDFADRFNYFFQHGAAEANMEITGNKTAKMDPFRYNYKAGRGQLAAGRELGNQISGSENVRLFHAITARRRQDPEKDNIVSIDVHQRLVQRGQGADFVADELEKAGLVRKSEVIDLNGKSFTEALALWLAERPVVKGHTSELQKSGDPNAVWSLSVNGCFVEFYGKERDGKFKIIYFEKDK